MIAKDLVKKIEEHCNGLELLKNASLSVGADDYAEIYDFEKRRLETIIIECEGENDQMPKSKLNIGIVKARYLIPLIGHCSNCGKNVNTYKPIFKKKYISKGKCSCGTVVYIR